MTNPNEPDAPRTPAYQQPPAAAAPAYGSSANPSGPVPGKTLGIVAFILSFFIQILGLILGIVALVQSKKAGYKNGWAVAAIVISAILMVLGVILLIAFGGLIFGGLAAACAEFGPGTHTLEGGGTITCE